MIKEKIVIVEYDPKWEALYRKEEQQILSVIGDTVVAIEHIGSTAVRGLGGKPTIDIMIAVRELSDADKCIRPLRSIGYTYVPEYEETTPERRFLHKGSFPLEQHYHLHMVENNSDFWKRHLLFRDYLKTHPEATQEYYQLKRKLASKHGSNRDAYTNAKTSFIESIVAKAKLAGRAEQKSKAS